MLPFFFFFQSPETNRLGCAVSKIQSNFQFLCNFLQCQILQRQGISFLPYGTNRELGPSGCHTCRRWSHHPAAVSLLTSHSSLPASSVDLWVWRCSLKMLLWLHWVCIKCPSLHQLTLRELCRGGKIIFPVPFWALSWDPCNKRQMSKRKTKRSWFHMCTSCIHGRYPGKNKWLPVGALNLGLNTVLVGNGLPWSFRW